MTPMLVPPRSLVRAATISVSLAIVAAIPAIAGEADGNIVASVDTTPEELITHLGVAFRFVETDVVEISAGLSEPAGPGGVTMGTASSLEPNFSTLFFGAGETWTSITETFPSGGFVPLYPGFEARRGYFGLSQPPPGIEIGEPNTLWHVQIREASSRGDLCAVDPDPQYCCVVNFLGCLLCFVGWDTCEFCPFGRPSGVEDATPARRGPSWVTSLQRYRDEVLSSTAEGRIYVNLYSAHATNLMRAIVASPSLARDLFYARDDWVAGIQALVDGQGNQFTVTQKMQDDLTALLDEFGRAGSPELAAVISYQRDRLLLDNLSGLSMTEFQQQVESGASAVESSSWGEIKSRYVAPELPGR